VAVFYTCRYCNFCSVLEGNNYSDAQLGFDQLTPRERKAIITNNMSGYIRVHIVYDTCQRSLETNPELSLLPYFYQ
jgi:hypothetical protein